MNTDLELLASLETESKFTCEICCILLWFRAPLKAVIRFYYSAQFLREEMWIIFLKLSAPMTERYERIRDLNEVEQYDVCDVVSSGTWRYEVL